MRTPALLFAAALGLATAVHAQESTCVSCHLEEEDEDLSAPVEEWRMSVHAEAGVSCDACHGGDPQEEDGDLSMDEDEAGFIGTPGRREVIDFCGSCHEAIAEGFRQSVMGQRGTEGARVATCTTCHMIDGHAIGHADTRAILTVSRCGECHEGERAIALRDTLEQLNALIGKADARVEPVRDQIDTSLLDQDLRQAREHAVVVAHTYDLERIREVAKGTALRLGRVEFQAERLESEVSRRRRIGAAVVAFFALAFVSTLRLSSNLRRRNSANEVE